MFAQLQRFFAAAAPGDGHHPQKISVPPVRTKESCVLGARTVARWGKNPGDSSDLEPHFGEWPPILLSIVNGLQKFRPLNASGVDSPILEDSSSATAALDRAVRVGPARARVHGATRQRRLPLACVRTQRSSIGFPV